MNYCHYRPLSLLYCSVYCRRGGRIKGAIRRKAFAGLLGLRRRAIKGTAFVLIGLVGSAIDPEEVRDAISVLRRLSVR